MTHSLKNKAWGLIVRNLREIGNKRENYDALVDSVNEIFRKFEDCKDYKSKYYWGKFVTQWAQKQLLSRGFRSREIRSRVLEIIKPLNQNKNTVEN